MDRKILEIMRMWGTTFIWSYHVELCLVYIVTEYHTAITMVSHIDLHIGRDSHRISIILEPLSKFFESIPGIGHDEMVRHR
jgi:hypothetical protein